MAFTLLLWQALQRDGAPAQQNLPEAPQLEPKHLLQRYSNRLDTTALLLLQLLLLSGTGFTVLVSHHVSHAQDPPMPN